MKRLSGSRGNPGAEAALIALLVLLTVSGARATPPLAFDWRNVVGVNFVSGVRNSGNCGSSYIFAPVAMVESRQMIAAGRFGQPVTERDYSEQYILSCGAGTSGGFDCVAGYCSDVLYHLRDVGAPRESCFIYRATDLVCPATCPDSGGPLLLFTPVISVGLYSAYPGEAVLMQEICDNGPVAVSMDVYSDFLSYDSGIYIHTYGNFIGGVDVVIVGWGMDLGTGYWIVKNSWGPAWAEDGYFRIARANQGNCSFASWVWTCTVELPPVSAVGPPAWTAGLLQQNSPNPFNPVTTIRYRVPADGPMTLRIHDTAGRLVATLVDDVRIAGLDHEAVWNGRDDRGRRVASGAYFYRLEVGGFSETKRMVLVK